MKIVTIHAAKTNLSRLLAEVEAGEEVVVARGDTPIAKLIPFSLSTEPRKPGSMKGLVDTTPEFFEPLPDEELGDWE